MVLIVDMHKNTQIEAVWNTWVKGWKEQVLAPLSFSMPEHFTRLSSMFSPGPFYFYILDVYDLKLEYISPSVKEVLGIDPQRASMKKLLSVLSEETLPIIARKEATGSDFLNRYLRTEERLDYKYVYTYPYINHHGEVRDMMIQVNPLSLSGSGKVQHLMGIHTDVSHLNLRHDNTISFISLKGRTNYTGVATQSGRFSPELVGKELRDLAQGLSKREIGILQLLAQGHNDDQIADTLNISVFTVRTHRRNMLRKTGCKNSIALVTECLMGGIV